jgi:glycosyltransferase involved in cell wall biosynthesis
MEHLLEPSDELHLLVSGACRAEYQGFGPQVRYITYPASGENRVLRSASEYFYTPFRLPLSHIDVYNSPVAPLFNPCPLVLHIKSMHAYAFPETVPRLVLAFRRLIIPHSVRAAAAIIANSQSLYAEILKYLDVPKEKIHIVYEAVNHDIFKPSERAAARASLHNHGVTRPYVLFVSHLYRHKNCANLLRAFALVRHQLAGRQLVFVGHAIDAGYKAEIDSLIAELGIGDDVVFVGRVPHAETARFYQGADVFAYPSFNETFGLTILEAMACGTPVVTSNTTSMPETAGGAAILVDPHSPQSIAEALRAALLPEAAERLRARGLDRAAQFTWNNTARQTLDVYRGAMRRADS